MTQNHIKYPFLDLATINAPYADEIRRALSRVVDSGYYIGGPEVEHMEDALARLVGVPYAVGVSNGLDALRLIFRAYIELGRLSPGDEVIVPANTYIASVLAVTDNALTPVFVEPDMRTHNIDPTLIERAITARTRAILTVHLYGRTSWSTSMAEIARRHNLIVVEDNAQAIGAVADVDGMFATRRTGSLGHAAAFSFYPTKNIGALGDAGAVTTHDSCLADAIRAIRNYGSIRKYENIYAGLNCRLDPMQAAVIALKLPNTDAENAYRRRIAGIYDEIIENAAVEKPLYDNGALSSVWHQYVVRVKDRDRFRSYMLKNGVATDVHYPTPPHLQPCYAQYSHLSLPIAERLAREVVSLPISRCTSPDDAAEIARIINSYRAD